MRPIGAPLGTAVFLMTSVVWGHGLGPDRAVVRLSGDTVHLVATPSIRTLPFLDRNRDGNVSGEELRQFQNAVLHRYGPQFFSVTPLFDDDRASGATAQRDFFQNVRLPHRHGDSPVRYVRVERRYKLEGADSERVRVKWTGAHRTVPTSVTVLRTSAGKTPRQQRPMSAPQTTSLLRSSPSHVFDFRQTERLPRNGASMVDSPRPSAGLPEGMRQFGLVVAGLLMALGVAHWRKP